MGNRFQAGVGVPWNPHAGLAKHF